MAEGFGLKSEYLIRLIRNSNVIWSNIRPEYDVNSIGVFTTVVMQLPGEFARQKARRSPTYKAYNDGVGPLRMLDPEPRTEWRGPFLAVHSTLIANA